MEQMDNSISIEIMGRSYNVKCPPDKVSVLQESASYLDNKMASIHEEGSVLSLDRIAVIAALNITHDLLVQKQQKGHYIDLVGERIQALQDKIETALHGEEQPA